MQKTHAGRASRGIISAKLGPKCSTRECAVGPIGSVAVVLCFCWFCWLCWLLVRFWHPAPLVMPANSREMVAARTRPTAAGLTEARGSKHEPTWNFASILALPVPKACFILASVEAAKPNEIPADGQSNIEESLA